MEWYWSLYIVAIVAFILGVAVRSFSGKIAAWWSTSVFASIFKRMGREKKL